MSITSPAGPIPHSMTFPPAAHVAAIASTAGALLAWPLAVIDLPQSGPMCQQQHCVTFPFSSAVYSPIDYLWMFPATVAVLSFAALLAIIEPLVTPSRWVAARLASRAAGAGAVILVVAFAVQIFVVQPSIIKGESEALTMWTQFNPHGGFIALESLGYLFLSLALLAVSRLVPGRRASRLLVRIVAAALGGLGILLLPLLAALLGANLEYLYEVTAISLVWTAILVVSLPLVRSIDLERRASPAPQNTQ